jgi:hypothetical protein
MADVRDLSSRSIDQLGLSPGVAQALRDVQGEIAEAYRENFIVMVQTLQQQTAALERIQSTLQILVQHLAPELSGRVPAAFSVAAADERPDLAKALVVADPISAGFTLSQAGLAEALGLKPTDVSILVKAFGLANDSKCAVVVRKGKTREIVNYHPQAIQRFRNLVKKPPGALSDNARSALRRVRAQLRSGS